MKDPDTGKRISRPNSENKWISQEVPELRVIDDDLWQRVKDRQTALEVEPTTKAEGKSLVDRRRPRYLFSGLIKCASCGGGFSMISQSLLGCSTARNKNTCDNRLTIKREKVEQRILTALRERLMEPALFAEFCQVFTEEMSRLRMDATASLAGKRCEIDEPDAWALVRAARDAAIRTDDPALAISAGDNTATIDVMAGGDWQSGFAVSPSAARMLDIYLPYAASGKSPTVLAQIGQSLDGFIATASGHSHYVTGEAGLDHLHRLRALSDVVVVGAGTAVADDPRLTVRRADGPNPVRAVIDAGGRVSRDRRMFRDGAAPTLVLTSPDTLARHPLPDGVEAVAVAGTDGTLPPAAIIEALSARGLNRISSKAVG